MVNFWHFTYRFNLWRSNFGEVGGRGGCEIRSGHYYIFWSKILVKEIQNRQKTAIFQMGEAENIRPVRDLGLWFWAEFRPLFCTYSTIKHFLLKFGELSWLQPHQLVSNWNMPAKKWQMKYEIKGPKLLFAICIILFIHIGYLCILG